MASGLFFLALDFLHESGPFKFYNLAVAGIAVVVPEPSLLALLVFSSGLLLCRRPGKKLFSGKLEPGRSVRDS